MVEGSAAERREAVALALARGINYFDTAPGYGSTASETNLAATLRALDARPVIATKVAIEAADFGDIAAAVLRSARASLERLGVVQLPLLQMHNRVGAIRADKAPFGSGALLSVVDVLGSGGVCEGFEALRARGLVRCFGCSAYGGDMAAVRQLIDSGRFDVIIVHYSALNRSAFVGASAQAVVRDYAGIAAHAAAVGMGVIALRVLEGGALSGEPAAATAVRANPDYAASVAQAQGLAATLGPELPIAEGAIRYVLSNPAVATTLIGFSNRQQIEAAASCSARGPLPAGLLARIDR